MLPASPLKRRFLSTIRLWGGYHSWLRFAEETAWVPRGEADTCPRARTQQWQEALSSSLTPKPLRAMVSTSQQLGEELGGAPGPMPSQAQAHLPPLP